MLENEKRKPGRPRKDERVSEDVRPRRRRVTNDFQGKLDVGNKDPEFDYYWALDQAEDGSNIFNLTMNDDWELCKTDEGLRVGTAYVYDSSSAGSIYRQPTGNQGDYLYLLKKRKEWVEQDRKKDLDAIAAREASIFKAEEGDGQYGSAKYE